MSENKREKFLRLAENRVNSVLKQLELISNLSNRSAYEYTQEDVNKILRCLKGAISDLEHSFSSENKGKKFTLR